MLAVRGMEAPPCLQGILQGIRFRQAQDVFFTLVVFHRDYTWKRDFITAVLIPSCPSAPTAFPLHRRGSYTAQ